MKPINQILLALLSGLLLALPWMGLAPGWILFVALVPLLALENNFDRNKKTSAASQFFRYAFLAFFIWNLLSCWWIMRSHLVGMLTIVSINALLMAGVWWLFHLMKRQFNVGLGYFSFLAFWLAFEYIHFNWDLEWPWMTLGNGFANQVKLIQWYEYTGVLGGSAWVLGTNLLIYRAIERSRQKQWFHVFGRGTLAILLVLVPALISKRLYNQQALGGEETCHVLVLQPNVNSQSEKFKEGNEYKQQKQLIHWIDSLVDEQTDFVLAPETALPVVIPSDSLGESKWLAPFVHRTDKVAMPDIALGVYTREDYSAEDRSATARYDDETKSYFDVYNTALLVNASGDIQEYRKNKLVSGVEKMPYSRYFSWIERFVVDMGGVTGSLGRTKMPSIVKASNGLLIAPVICFESVFGANIGQQVKQGANLIFILTNDGWWEDAEGIQQHLALARLRAIETRRSIARSANTGISAFIDKYGNLIQTSAWNQEVALKGKLELGHELTFYVQNGDYLGRVSLFVSVMLLLYLLVQRQVKKEER